MEYKVIVTEYAIKQMREITSYITSTLLAPNAADRWLIKIKRKISNLGYMPLRFPVLDENPWGEKGFHKMVVDKFIVYYLVEEARKEVWVTAIIYERRDQLFALKEMPMEERD